MRRNSPSVRTSARRGAVALLIASVLGTTAVLVAPVLANASFSTSRFSGGNRYDTAAKVATATFPNGAATAIIATGANYPDALAGSFLAGALGAPILLTTPAVPIPSETTTALSTLKTKNVILLGGQLAIGDDVAQKLAQTTSTSSGGGNLNVTRIAGNTRFETASMIAQQQGTTVGTVSAKKTAIVASGLNFPDALSGGPAAFASHLPVLLTDPQTETAVTEQTLQKLGIQQVLLLGGTAAVSSGVQTSLSSGGTRTVTRIGGADRTDTAALFFEYELANLGFKNTAVGLANGANFPDALTGASNTGSLPTGILLTQDPNTLGQYSTAELQKQAPTLTAGVIFGGPGAVTTSAENAFIQAAGGSANASGHAITLASNSVGPGGTINGTIANAKTVQSLSVSGCGLTNQPLTVSGSSGTTTTTVPTSGVSTSSTSSTTTTTTIASSSTTSTTTSGSGSFTVTIPSSQPAGSCTLTFSVTPTGGSAAAQQTFPITVTTAAPKPVASTSAPDLVTASASAGAVNDQVTYVFDKTATLATGGAAKFHVYSASGIERNALSSPAPLVSGQSVTVNFAKGDTAGGTVATVGPGAVTGGGVGNPIGAVGLTGAAPPPTAGGTSEPNLISVGNFQFGATPPTADFTFDAPPVPASPATAFAPANFSLVTKSDNLIGGSTVVGKSGNTITIGFPQGQSVLAGDIARGVVLAGTVATSASDTSSNPMQTALQGLGNSLGTSSVELTAITVATSNTVSYTFDGNVQTTVAPAAATPVASAFGLYDSHANSLGTPSSAVVSSTDPKTVTVTFPGGTALATAVGGSVAAGGVTAASGQRNQPTSGVIPLASTAPGKTALPQLISVKYGTDAFMDTTVVFTFDKPLSGYTPQTADFVLYDNKATPTTPTAVPLNNLGCGGSVSGATVTWTNCQGGSGFPTPTTGYVLAAVQDSANSGVANRQPKFPEGAVVPG